MEKKLEDICVFIRNGANIKNDRQKKGIPITRIETISDGKVNEEKMGYADIIDDKYKEYYLVKDDILMSHINSLKHLGKVAIFNGTNKIIHGMNLLNIRFSNEVYAPYYYYYFKTINFKNKLKKISKQSVNQSSFSVNDLKKITVNFIEKDKQIKIVNTLDKVQKLIDLNQKQINLLDELIKSQFVEMFGDPKTNDKNWIKVPMGDYMTVLTDFSSNGSYKTLDSIVVMYDEPNYAYMVRTTDLENEDYKNNVKYITERVYNFLAKSKVYPNDIIMNKIGSAGKVYIMPDVGMPVSLGRNAFLFRYNDDIVPLFIYYLLKSEYGTNEILQYVRGAVTKTITKDDVRKVKIIVPPIELQNQFADIVKQIKKQKFNYEKNLEKSQELMNTLMNQYFN